MAQLSTSKLLRQFVPQHGKGKKSIIDKFFITAVVIIPLVCGEVQNWSVNAVSPVTNLVSRREDLDFRLLGRQGVKAGDCIRFVFNNPYEKDSPETYQSFDMSDPYSQPCKLTTTQKATCSTIDAQTFEIKFLEDNPNPMITGTTDGKPFQNPYSSRHFSYITTNLYGECELDNLVYEGETSIYAFQQQVILDNEITFTSSSRKLAVPNAVLTVKFKVKSMMPQEGFVSLRVPPWYLLSAQRIPVQESSDSMLSFTSQATFESHNSKGFTVEDYNFDASSRSLLIFYRGSTTIDAGEEIEFKITDFKNPVNQATKTGFSLTVMDKEGYLIDQSESNLRLNTPMTEVGELVGKEVMMLGDTQGTNVGRVFEYNKVSFFMSSYIPFEQFCYFKFIFPEKLRIDEELTIIEGDGIFKPFENSNYLPVDYWKTDIEKNTVFIEGCKLPQFLNSRPFGVITFSYVLLPDYVKDTDPVQLFAYSDHAYRQVVFEESMSSGGGMTITREMLQPGHLALMQFRPSDMLAFVKDVDYTIQIAPSHDMMPSTRIILTMPEAIYFDPRKGCTVTYTEAECELVPDTNEIMLTEVFKERTPGGTVLKFIIQFGDNPVGAKYAGDWGARTEGIFDDRYYIIDGADGGYSFEAEPGHINSQLNYQGMKTFFEETTYDFTFKTQHPVAKFGFLQVTLPDEMTFTPEMISSQTIDYEFKQNGRSASNDLLKPMNLTTSTILFQLPKGHQKKHNPMTLSIKGVRTPRSFRPSSEFAIKTISTEGYVIDAGGQDITVTMSEMNILTSLQISIDDLSNGAVTAYHFQMESFVWLKQYDRLLITTPPSVSFGPDGLSCLTKEPDAIGVTQISCENINEQTFVVSFVNIERPDGVFEFTVDGLKNPPNFRRSDSFSNIFLETGDFFSIQELLNYEGLFVQTDTPGLIRDYELQQSTEVFGLDATYTIKFLPFNPISTNGMITLDWTSQVEFIQEDAICKVETHQAFSDDIYCTIDFVNRQIAIRNVFRDQHFSHITITLDTIKNPLSNIKLEKFKLRTYDDQDKLFPIDMLDYDPLTICNWPCEKCSSDKEFCFQCWDRPDVQERFLITTEEYSTCDSECHKGFTTNGNEQLHCTQCDTPCATCVDQGAVGDKYKCLTCAEGYPLRMGDSCVPECPPGTFQKGDECLKCSSECKTCEASAENCLSCNQDTDISFLLNNKCIESCPPRMGNLAGVCFDCVYPCLECRTAPDICSSCSQDDGIAFLLGPTCTNTCPLGYIVNETERKCEGCGTGCIDCDPDDQRICLKCARGLMQLENECVQDCPKGYFSDYDSKECRPLSDLDISLIPIPCIIIAVVFFFISYAGSRQKQKHLLIPNWLVLMGFLEHGILLSQIILTGKYGTAAYMVFIIIAWLIYVATNVVFFFMFMKQIVKEDQSFRSWRNRNSHKWAKWLITIGGFLGSWKTYKLTYSAFWGFKLTPATFSRVENFRDIQKKFLYINIIGCYALVILICFIGMIDLNWGTQLNMQHFENFLIFSTLIGVGLWEQKKLNTEYLINKKKEQMGKINVMTVLEESEQEFQKTREHLLSQNEINKLFIERKFNELVKLFGDRVCKSDYQEREKTEDPRRCKTWPISPDLDYEPEPLSKLPEPYPDNCYSRGLTEEQMKQMQYLSKNMATKALQSDAFDADQNLRKDAHLVGHHRDLADQKIEFESLHGLQERRRNRGRKNRYFKQIDNEDHEAGFLLDDDDEGEYENLQARKKLVEEANTVDAEQKEEEKKMAQAEAKQRALQLTEENLRLKKVLEEQRVTDAQDQKDIHARIVDEEKRRLEILADIEKARKERMDRHNALKSNLSNEKELHMQEVEDMMNVALAKPNLSDEERNEIKEHYEAEKARVEAEYNEKMIKSQQDEEPSKSANSPAKISKTGVVKIAPEKIVSPKSPASSKKKKKKSGGSPDRSSRKDSPTRSRKEETPKKSGSPKRSAKSSQVISPGGASGKMNISAMMTADGASALDGSFVMNTEFERRDFNEIDILGTLDRDEKGNIIVPVDPNTGSKVLKDKEGRPINQFGYLVSLQSGDVISNITNTTVFVGGDLDERGNIPMPFALEKFNFNPFDVLGTFFFENVEDLLSFKKTKRGDRFIDELGRSVSIQGFLVDEDGSVVNIAGVKRFDSKQFRQYGGLMPKLYNYYGKKFELQEVMGVFDRDNRGKIQLLLGKDERGKDVYVDKAGFMVNQRGYIVTRDGHVCSREGKVLFLRTQLKNGEFPKIFPFTRFNINRIIGDLEMDPGGQPILQKNDQGLNVDKQGRLVNLKGFLCDSHGNVVDMQGKVVFEKVLLEHNGDIPEIFRSNILRSDSQSSLSRFMSEIDRDQRFDDMNFGKLNAQIPRIAGASDTSYESMMEDSPSKYDKQNMRFNNSNLEQPYGQGSGQQKSARWAATISDNIKEEMSEYEAGAEPYRSKRKRSRGKYIVEQITGRDIQMASAYGGVAKPRIRKTAPRFSSIARIDRSGLQTSEGHQRPKPRMQNFASKPFIDLVDNMEKSPLPFKGHSVSRIVNKMDSKVGMTDSTTQRTGVTLAFSRLAGQTTEEALKLGIDPSIQQIESADDDADTTGNHRNKRSTMQKKKLRQNPKLKKDTQKAWPKTLQMPKYDRAFEHEFEKIHKRDIDQFIEGSDFEVESLAGLSDISKGTFKSVMQNPRMKGLEKVYLQRLEFQQLGQQKTKKNRAKPAVKREFLDRFCDDPRYIAKGEQLKFDVGGQTQTGSSGKKKQSQFEQPYMERNQHSQNSLLGQDIGLVQTTGLIPGSAFLNLKSQTPDGIKAVNQDSSNSVGLGFQHQQPSRQNMR